MSASLIGGLRSSAFRRSSSAVSKSLAGSCFSSESARGPSIMGFEDEAEQSFGRPCRQSSGTTKRTCELTSSIVPRATSFHCSVDLGFPPIALILCTLHATALSLVQRNSESSTQQRRTNTTNQG